MSAGDPVNLIEGQTPSDYHCQCPRCSRVIGELRPNAESYYSRLERRQYYDKSEQGKEAHVAKTPLHIARWAVQRFTQPGDWVLDPTIGAGTTAVEAITQGRNAAGMELQFAEVLTANVKKALQMAPRGECPEPDCQDPNCGLGGCLRAPTLTQTKLRIGDARTIGGFLGELDQEIALIVNNPPYSGDEHMSTLAADKGVHQSGTFKYQSDLPNLAFLKENAEYWETIKDIYRQSAFYLRPGGHFVVGVKDMMKNKAPKTIHIGYCDVLESIGLEFVGTAFLRHWPQTQFLNTYEKIWGVRPPLYQTISVFRKPE